MTFITRKGIYLVPILGILLVAAMLNWTDPTEKITSILLVFLLLYVVFASCILLLIRASEVVLQRFLPKLHARESMSFQRAYYLSSVIAFVPVCLLAMQSLNQVRPLDLILVLVLTFLAVFYVIKRTDS